MRSSWLTMPRNSARSRSSSRSDVKSCSTATNDSTSPSWERTGVAFSSALTLRPSGTRSSISSTLTVSPSLSASATDSSSSEISLPSARPTVITSSSCSGGWPGSRRPSTILLISRLTETAAPVLASKTTTPTGEVSISVSRSALARCSSRWRRALAITCAAWETNTTRTSSSSGLNSLPSSFPATKTSPTRPPPSPTGTARNANWDPTSTGGRSSGKAQRPDVAQQVRQSQGALGPAEVLEEPHPVRRRPHPLGLLGGQPGREELLHPAGVVQQHKRPVAGPGQRTGAVHKRLEHPAEIQALVDTQTRLAQPGQAVSEVSYLPVHRCISIGLRKGSYGAVYSGSDRKLTRISYKFFVIIMPILHEESKNSGDTGWER